MTPGKSVAQDVFSPTRLSSDRLFKVHQPWCNTYRASGRLENNKRYARLHTEWSTCFPFSHQPDTASQLNSLKQHPGNKTITLRHEYTRYHHETNTTVFIILCALNTSFIYIYGTINTEVRILVYMIYWFDPHCLQIYLAGWMLGLHECLKWASARNHGWYGQVS